MADVYEIATEDGGVFCKCSRETGSPVLIGKEGPLSFQKLVDQVYHPELAKEMRNKKSRTKRESRRGTRV
jgi:hypothetical protein